MRLFPIKKTELILPYNAQELCSRLRGLDNYKVSIKDDTFDLIFYPRSWTHKLDWSDFKGKFEERGNSTKVMFQSVALKERRKYNDLVFVIVFSIVFIFSLFSIGDFIDYYIDGLYTFIELIWGILLSVGMYSIHYFTRFISAQKQMAAIKEFLLSGT